MNKSVQNAKHWANKQRKWWNVKDVTDQGLRHNYVWHIREVMRMVGYLGSVIVGMELFFRSDFFADMQLEVARKNRFDPTSIENEKYFFDENGNRVSTIQAKRNWMMDMEQQLKKKHPVGVPSEDDKQKALDWEVEGGDYFRKIYALINGQELPPNSIRLPQRQIEDKVDDHKEDGIVQDPASSSSCKSSSLSSWPSIADIIMRSLSNWLGDDDIVHKVETWYEEQFIVWLMDTIVACGDSLEALVDDVYTSMLTAPQLPKTSSETTEKKGSKAE